MDVYWNATFMNQLAAQPLVEDVLDCMKFSSILNTDVHSMSVSQELLKCLTVAHLIPLRVSLP